MVYSTGNKVQCVSNVELWVKRYQDQSTPQRICYQVSGGAAVCYQGDRYENVRSYDGNYSAIVIIYLHYYTNNQTLIKNITITGYKFSHYQVIQQNIYGIYRYIGLDWWDTRESTGIVRRRIIDGYYGAGDLPLIYDGISVQFSQGEYYQVKIYDNNNTLIHTSPMFNTQPNVWIEPAQAKCSAESSQWEKVTSWQQLPTDDLQTVLQGDTLIFTVESKFFGTPSGDKLNFNPKPISPVTQSYLVATLSKNNDCKFPLWQTNIKPLRGTECVPEPHNCDNGYHWDEKLKKCVKNKKQCPPGTHWEPYPYGEEGEGRCVPDEKPKCPPGTVSQYECNGWLCCYDECGILIHSEKI